MPVSAWHLSLVYEVTTVECNIVVALCAGFYQESRVFIFATGIFFYKICYIQLIIPVVRKVLPLMVNVAYGVLP